MSGPADEGQPLGPAPGFPVAPPVGSPAHPPVAPVGRTWTFADSVDLEARAYGWMIGVVLPVLSLLPTLVGLAVMVSSRDVGLSDATATLPWVLLVPLLSAVPTFVAAFLVLPVTWLVGRRLRRVRSDRAHVAWTALTAGVLATVSTMVVALAMTSGTGDPFAFAWSSLPMGLAAGVAGALARRGQLRTARRRSDAGAGEEPGRRA
ncbi:hypothetical protein DEJ23_03310 [Curtobacterium sp. MCSS17_008]|uniref:hypothetical protein n=1 Tax=Curtobacterium sp. MCSS17_008 TaxID=2175647 RepID=UPI000DA7A815|nr:hypothetical protein [Curtobacterium sp. MCSS17_008]PZF58835.1 hypothetical protein DEJ23_03310 [Curtobacterium sp. MCSS17_008]